MSGTRKSEMGGMGYWKSADSRSRGYVVAIGMILCALPLTGCVAPGGGRADQNDDQQCILIERSHAEQLKRIDAVGSASQGMVNVFFPDGLNDAAKDIAQLIAAQYDYIRETTGFEIAYERVNVYLKRVPKIDRAHSVAFLIDACFDEENNASGWTLYVAEGRESVQEIVADNILFPGLHVHENVEASLSQDETNSPVANDETYLTPRGERRHKLHYTRWFREGFSDYAGLLAHRVKMSNLAFDTEKFPTYVLQESVKGCPFSALRRVGKDLFTFHQFTQEPVPFVPNPFYPHVGNTWFDYYEAALGLFLVIEDRYGQDAIKNIIVKVNRMERANGADLIGVVNEVLKADVVKIVQDFHFPNTGLYMDDFYPCEREFGLSIKEGLFVRLTDPEGAGALAGIRPKDVILSVNGERTVTNLDFETALYRAMSQASARIGIWREGEGESTVEMVLAK